MSTNPTPHDFDEVAHVHAEVERIALWRFRTAMDAAADGNRTLANRASLLMNGIDAWLGLIEYRREFRHLTAQLERK